MIKSVLYGLLVGHSGVILVIHGYSHLYFALFLVSLIASVLNIFKVRQQER